MTTVSALVQIWIPYISRNFTAVERRVLGNLSIMKYLSAVLYLAVVGILKGAGLPSNCFGWAEVTGTSIYLDIGERNWVVGE
jgi:hypothetical protein